MQAQRVLLRTFVAPSALLLVFLGVAGCAVPKVNPATEQLAADLPIADLHFHPGGALGAFAIKDAMDSNGVRWAGAGARHGDRSTWMVFSETLGDRFIAFGGMTELHRARFQGGVAAMEDAEHPIMRALLRVAEQDLNAGRIKGIGEIVVHNSVHPDPRMRGKARADAPSFRLFYQLVARYGGFLTLHMEGDPDSIAQLERLLASDRRGRILWNHCGSDTNAKDVRPLLDRHPNLFCELSARYPPRLHGHLAERQPRRKIFDSTGPDPAWLRLIEDFPDRFMIGTDADSRSDFDGAIRVVRTGLLPYLSPSTARMVAYENAQRLFALK